MENGREIKLSMHKKEFAVRFKGLLKVINHLLLVTPKTGNVYSTLRKRIVNSTIH